MPENFKNSWTIKFSTTISSDIQLKKNITSVAEGRNKRLMVYQSTSKLALVGFI